MTTLRRLALPICVAFSVVVLALICGPIVGTLALSVTLAGLGVVASRALSTPRPQLVPVRVHRRRG